MRSYMCGYWEWWLELLTVLEVASSRTNYLELGTQSRPVSTPNSSLASGGSEHKNIWYSLVNVETITHISSKGELITEKAMIKRKCFIIVSVYTIRGTDIPYIFDVNTSIRKGHWDFFGNEIV
jgi:hypothetical protein